jgi:mannose/fructose/N-acetylgalactosamine-specific phosphotransferase system component IID
MNNTYYQYPAANNNNPLNASYQNEYVYFSLLPFNLKKNLKNLNQVLDKAQQNQFNFFNKHQLIIQFKQHVNNY